MKNIVSDFKLISLAGLFALLAASAASAQSGSFIVAQHGKSVGTASFKFTASPDGYDSSSVVSIDMKDLNYKISNAEQLTKSNHIKHVQLSASVNSTAVNVTGAPDNAQFLLNISANGQSNTARLDQHPAAVFLPDFDPGAYETLLSLAVIHNNRDLWAIIPKQSGSVVPIKLATYADQKGTIDGKPIEVHHLVATISGSDTHLFSGPDNQLLQAELPEQGFALVRKGFVLTPPAKAGPPPTPPAQPDQAPPNQ